MPHIITESSSRRLHFVRAFKGFMALQANIVLSLAEAAEFTAL